MNNQVKRIILLPIFFGIVLTLTLISTTYYSKKELGQGINFSVSNIVVSQANRLSLYNEKGVELNLHSYTFFIGSEIMEGDSLVKKPNSSALLIYRKNTHGKFQKVKEFQPN